MQITNKQQMLGGKGEGGGLCGGAGRQNERKSLMMIILEALISDALPGISTPAAAVEVQGQQRLRRPC